MVDSDDLYGPMEIDDDLSTALGTETLVDGDVVPPGFDNTRGSSADTLPTEIFEHRRFLRKSAVPHCALDKRCPKIWDHDNFSIGVRYSFHMCSVRGERESLHQCKEADHTGEKCPNR